MPEAVVPDDGEETTGPERDAAPVEGNHRIELSTNYVSVVLDYPGATPDSAYWTWKRAMDYLAVFREGEREPVRLEAGINGFVTEQSHEPPAEQAGFRL